MYRSRICTIATWKTCASIYSRRSLLRTWQAKPTLSLLSSNYYHSHCTSFSKGHMTASSVWAKTQIDASRCFNWPGMRLKSGRSKSSSARAAFKWLVVLLHKIRLAPNSILSETVRIHDSSYRVRVHRVVYRQGIGNIDNLREQTLVDSRSKLTQKGLDSVRLWK